MYLNFTRPTRQMQFSSGKQARLSGTETGQNRDNKPAPSTIYNRQSGNCKC